jgi:glycosyltransferase involved in cell wall biosynthesis
VTTAEHKSAHWALASPFFERGGANRWLADQVPADRHRFTPVAPRVAPASIAGDGTATSGDGWKRAWQQIADAFALRPEGVVTLFPPLATVAGCRKRVTRRDLPVVAWCFNLGKLYGGMKGRLARFGLGAVDRFVCHSTFEVDQYSRWLRLPRDRFTFVPLQRGRLVDHDTPEDRERPFLVAMGSARRDYATLFEAVAALGYRTIVIAAPHAVAGLSVPANVEVRNGLTRDECYVLSQRARMNVVPIANEQTASGQVSVVQAMHLGRAVIATDCPGTRDYLRNEQNGLTVRAGDVKEMSQAIRRLWEDEAERQRLGVAARIDARDRFSDEAAGRHLTRILDEVLASR